MKLLESFFLQKKDEDRYAKELFSNRLNSLLDKTDNFDMEDADIYIVGRSAFDALKLSEDFIEDSHPNIYNGNYSTMHVGSYKGKSVVLSPLVPPREILCTKKSETAAIHENFSNITDLPRIDPNAFKTVHTGSIYSATANMDRNSVPTRIIVDTLPDKNTNNPYVASYNKSFIKNVRMFLTLFVLLITLVIIYCSLI